MRLFSVPSLAKETRIRDTTLKRTREGGSLVFIRQRVKSTIILTLLIKILVLLRIILINQIYIRLP